MDKKEIINYTEIFSNAVIAILLFLFPIFFLPITTDFFIIPKQILVIFAACLLLLLWGVRIVVERKIVVNMNPLNLPVLFFMGIILVSALLSPSRIDSLIQTVPAVAAILFFIIIVNNVRDRRYFSFILSAYLLGAALSVVLTLAYYFKIYFLPIPAIQSQFFNSFGSVIQQLIYLIPAFIFCVFLIAKRINFPKIRVSSNTTSDVGFFIQAITGIVIGIGIILIAYQMLLTPNKPIMLPYIYGFQTAFASISQDAQRFILSLLFGSGYGTFLVDFTRFKLPSFNLEQNIWNLSFSYSSTYFLELLATTGVLGGLSFIFMIIGMIRSGTAKNPLFIAIFSIFILAIILPFSFTSVFAMFVLLGIYASYLNIDQDKRVYDVALALVASKNGGLSFAATPEDERLRGKTESPLLPGVVFLLILVLVGFTGYYTYNFALSDKTFADSLRAAQQNNGQLTYTLQTQAINEFPYRSDYHRIFSQINLALANSLAQGIQPGSSPSAEVRQNIATLLQQSINSGRNAVTISPLTSINWQNLSQVYRSLINVGQNADQFAVASQNQAIALDQYNPQLYVELGGIYYQLKLWDQAQNQFQVAINLKRDFANAYYNLGHVFEEKGDYQNALTAYQLVKQLSANNKDNLARIDTEIKAVEGKLGEQKAAAGSNVTPETEQTPLSISEPENQLPAQNPKVKVSPPPAGPIKTTPTPEPTEAEASPTPTQ